LFGFDELIVSECWNQKKVSWFKGRIIVSNPSGNALKNREPWEAIRLSRFTQFPTFDMKMRT
jgi:hypothetical protein